MPLNPRIFVYTLNAIMLLVVLLVSARMTNAGVTYSWNVGNSEVQTVMKMRILKSLVLLIATGLFATLFNLLAINIST
ncbi:MAG: hypothetical protein HYZ63_03865 [Candidatus Andersenbacteria bacterium]|nr:hypothetical protein [Candidatus Andersenbacteria bacterium]